MPAKAPIIRSVPVAQGVVVGGAGEKMVDNSCVNAETFAQHWHLPLSPPAVIMPTWILASKYQVSKYTLSWSFPANIDESSHYVVIFFWRFFIFGWRSRFHWRTHDIQFFNWTTLIQSFQCACRRPEYKFNCTQWDVPSEVAYIKYWIKVSSIKVRITVLVEESVWILHNAACSLYYFHRVASK